MQIRATPTIPKIQGFLENQRSSLDFNYLSL
jgi:hypothetical protein